MSNISGHLSDPLSPNLFVDEKISVSRVKKAAGIYSFRIEGYSGLSAKVGDSTESPEFELCGHLWQLRVFPGGSLEAHRTNVSFYLASKSSRSAKASYKLSVCSQVSGGADECFASSGVRLFEAKGLQIDGWGRDKFMTATMLQDADYGFAINDSVVFKVEIVVFGELESTSFPPVSTVNSNVLLPSLSRSLRQLLTTGDAADIIINIGSSQLPAHRCILCARSPVFSAMLKHEMSESRTGTIVIDDVEPEVMQECLIFMYTDECSNPMVMDVMGEALLCAASKYQIAALIVICESYLSHHVTDTSAITLLKLADMHALSKMKDCILRYIAQHTTGVVQTIDYLSLDGELLAEVAAVLDTASRRKGCGKTFGGELTNEKKFITNCTLM